MNYITNLESNKKDSIIHKILSVKTQFTKGVAMLLILFFLLVAFTLSYFLLWLVYRKGFKSKKKISKFLVFIVGVGLVAFYYIPYVYPSYWEFRNMCRLNNLPKSEEKYNKILKYFGVKLGDDKIDFFSEDKTNYKNRIKIYLYIDFIDNNNPKLLFDNIDKFYFRPFWQSYTPSIYGNEGNMDFRLEFDGEIECKKLLGELDGQ